MRSGRLGDVALLLPAVRALQSRGYAVSWLIGPDAYRLVQNVSTIDWIVLKGGLTGGRDIVRRLPKTTYYVLLEQPSLEASLAICASGNATPILSMAKWPTTTHALERYWHAVHCDTPGREDRAYWGIPIKPMKRLPMVLINPCASTPDRDWTLEGYVRIAEQVRTLGMTPVIVHGGSSREVTFVKGIQANVRALERKCDLEELLSMLSSAMCLVSPDSGPVHLAGITGTPVIGLYNRTRLEHWGPYWSRQWSVWCEPGQVVPVTPVLERLTALHEAGYPRCGGEGARITMA